MSSFDENDLVELHLGELSPEHERSLRAAIEADPELAARSAEIAAALGAIRVEDEASAPDGGVDEAVLEHHWRRLRPQLAPAPRALMAWWRPFSLGTVCGLALPCLYLLFHAQGVGPMASPGVSPPASRGGESVLSGGATAPVTPPPGAGSRVGIGDGRRWMPVAGQCPVIQPEPVGQVPADENAWPERARSMAVLSAEPALPPVPEFRWSAEPRLPWAQPESVKAAPAEEAVEGIQPAPVKKREGHHPVSFTAAALGSLTVGRSDVSVQDIAGTTSASAQTLSEGSVPGAMVSVETPITRRLGVRLDGVVRESRYSYTSGDYLVSGQGSSSFFQSGSVQARQYEVSPSAVLRLPGSERVSPYLQVGGGMLVFVPHDNPGVEINRAYRASWLLGAGAKVHLAPHLDLTAGYRGVIYRTPAYSYQFVKTASANESFPVLVRRTLTSEPFLGLTYTFGKERRD